MYKFFNETETYVLPSGRTVTGLDLKNSSDYPMVTGSNTVMRIDGGRLSSIMEYAALAESYGYSVDGHIDASEVLTSINAIEQNRIRTRIQNDMVAPIVQKIAQMTAQNFTDEQALQVKDIYPDYQLNYAYKKDEFFKHDGELYKVNQNHVSASQWEPGSVGTESLYTHITLNEEGYPIWKQPTGAHDAYNIGDIVEYNGKLYKSLIDGNVYSPDVYPAGWEEYTEPEA